MELHRARAKSLVKYHGRSPADRVNEVFAVCVTEARLRLALDTSTAFSTRSTTAGGHWPRCWTVRSTESRVARRSRRKRETSRAAVATDARFAAAAAAGAAASARLCALSCALSEAAAPATPS